MTNWQDKYKDVDFCGPAWYWHRTGTLSRDFTWTPIRVARLWSKEHDCWNLFAYGISQNPVPISEDFPNGPRCLTPDEMGKTEILVEALEKILENYELIDKEENLDYVSLGSEVLVEDLDTHEKIKYIILDYVESEPEFGKISISSPIGKGLLGKKKGEIAEIRVPAGHLKYKILEIK